MYSYLVEVLLISPTFFFIYKFIGRGRIPGGKGAVVTLL